MDNNLHIISSADLRPDIANIIWELNDNNYVTPTIMDSNFADQILKPLVDQLIAESAARINHPKASNPIEIVE